jgi:hypothetical protein
MTDDNESLNAGNELDDNPAPIITAKESDIDADLKGISDSVTALESVFKDIAYLHLDIKKSGGMNQSFAMEAIAVIPNFGDNTPVGYYSKDLSATRLKVSLEEISKGMWAIIAAIAAAVIAAVYKLYKWITGGSKESTPEDVVAKCESTEKALESVPAITTDLQAAAEEIKSELSNGEVVVPDKNGKDIKITNLQMVLDNVVSEHVLEKFHRVLNVKKLYIIDFMKHGKYSQAVEAAAKGVPTALMFTVENYKRLDEIIKLAEQNKFDEADALLLQMAGLEKKPIYSFGGAQHTAADANKTLREMYEKTKDEALFNEELKIEEVIKRVCAVDLNKTATSFVKVISKSATTMSEINEVLKLIKDRSETLSTKANVDANERLLTISKGIKKYDAELRIEYFGTLGIITMLQVAVNNTGGFINETIGNLMQAMKALVDSLDKKTKSIDTWQRINATLNELSNQLKAFSNSYYREDHFADRSVK